MPRKRSREHPRSTTTDLEKKSSNGSRKRKAEEGPDDADMAVSKRRHQFQIQNQWIPITEDFTITSSTIVPKKETNNNSFSERESSPSEVFLGSQFRFQNYFTTPVEARSSPLPNFNWADSKEVWQIMLNKELQYTRNSHFLERHPAILPKMRSILLDWLIEVCEVYRLHRETFNLATDFFDRYLSAAQNIGKQQLQLVGISALFIAAKLEEIYPPKLSEFAYVTDGACNESEILDQEILILKALNWDLSPITPTAWLNVYLQVSNIEQTADKDNGFMFPQYSSHMFIQIARLLDLCILDVGSVQFTYSILAASALYHTSSQAIALAVSGLQMMDMLPCVQWMAPFAVTLREIGTAEVKFFPTIQVEDCHNIQTHVINLSILENAQSRQQEVFFSDRSSPDLSSQLFSMLTPPQSNKKLPEEGETTS